jgi:putative redox protein
MDPKVTWKNRLSFTGSGPSGYSLPLGTDASIGGDDDGFRPMELIAIGLAGCTAMDTISILQKKRQNVTALEVQVHAERAKEHPKVFTHISLEYLIEGHNIDPAAVERSIELSKTKYCPVQAMLEKACKIEHTYLIKEIG